MCVKLPLWGISYLYNLLSWSLGLAENRMRWFLDNMEEYEWAGTGTPHLQRYSN